MTDQGGNYYCGVCYMDFTSQSIMDAHFIGSKHQKRIEGNELLRRLQRTERCFTHDEVTGKCTCLSCHVELTSPQLLEAHLRGTKHKNTVNPPAASKVFNSVPANSKPSISKRAFSRIAIDKLIISKGLTPVPAHTTAATPGTGGDKRPADGLELPSAKKRNPIPGTEKHFCDTCQAGCNSDAQWEQHKNSRKHLNKITGGSITVFKSNMTSIVYLENS